MSKMDRTEIALWSMVCTALTVLIIVMYVFIIPPDKVEDSPDYIGDGLYQCPNCNWEGYVGLMVFHDGGVIYIDHYYCPECGHEIDVRE